MRIDELKNILDSYRPKRFSAFIKAHKNELKDALKSGLTRAEILEIVNQKEYAVTAQTFSTTLNRAMKKVDSTQRGGKGNQKQTVPTVVGSSPTASLHNPIGSKEDRESHASHYVDAPAQNTILNKLRGQNEKQ